MDEVNYILLIIGLVAFTLLFGGHNNQLKIEYNLNYFDNINKIIYYEQKMQRFNTQYNFNDKNYINIEDYIVTSQIIIPNLVDMFFIKIKPKSLFDIEDIFKLDKKEHIMIVFNNYNTNYNLIELVIRIEANSAYFYSLDKKISVVSIYDLFNNSDQTINLTLFFMKRPYWYK